MKKTALCSTLVLGMFLVPAVALAKPQVTLNVTAEKEVTELSNGKRVTKLVPAKKIAPNEVILYTVNYVNKGDETATNAVVEDPIPKGTVYIPNSAQGEAGEPQFSIDNGKSYHAPALLTYQAKLANGKTEQRVASSSQYTNIRWTIKEIPAGASGKVQFKVKVK